MLYFVPANDLAKLKKQDDPKWEKSRRREKEWKRWKRKRPIRWVHSRGCTDTQPRANQWKADEMSLTCVYMCAKGAQCLPIRNKRNASQCVCFGSRTRRWATVRTVIRYDALWKNCNFAHPFCRILFTVHGFHQANKIVISLFLTICAGMERSSPRQNYSTLEISANFDRDIRRLWWFCTENNFWLNESEDNNHMNQNSDCLN